MTRLPENGTLLADEIGEARVLKYRESQIEERRPAGGVPVDVEVEDVEHDDGGGSGRAMAIPTKLEGWDRRGYFYVSSGRTNERAASGTTPPGRRHEASGGRNHVFGGRGWIFSARSSAY